MDIILFQRISGGFEYRYNARDGEVYKSWAYSADEALAGLRRKLGWTDQRFNRAERRKF